MNENTKTKIIIDAIWEYLPQMLLICAISIIVLVGQLWIGQRDLMISIAAINEKQTKICDRVLSCVNPILAGIKTTINTNNSVIEAHVKGSDPWRNRVQRIEDQLYEANSKTELIYSIDARLKSLERKIN